MLPDDMKKIARAASAGFAMPITAQTDFDPWGNGDPGDDPFGDMGPTEPQEELPPLTPEEEAAQEQALAEWEARMDQQAERDAENYNETGQWVGGGMGPDPDELMFPDFSDQLAEARAIADRKKPFHGADPTTLANQQPRNLRVAQEGEEVTLFGQPIGNTGDFGPDWSRRMLQELGTPEQQTKITEMQNLFPGPMDFSTPDGAEEGLDMNEQLDQAEDAIPPDDDVLDEGADEMNLASNFHAFLRTAARLDAMGKHDVADALDVQAQSEIEQILANLQEILADDNNDDVVVTAGKIKGPGIPDGSGPVGPGRGKGRKRPIKDDDDDDDDKKKKDKIPGVPDGTGPVSPDKCEFKGLKGGKPRRRPAPSCNSETDDDENFALAQSALEMQKSAQYAKPLRTKKDYDEGPSAGPTVFPFDTPQEILDQYQGEAGDDIANEDKPKAVCDACGSNNIAIVKDKGGIEWDVCLECDEKSPHDATFIGELGNEDAITNEMDEEIVAQAKKAMQHFGVI